MILILLIVFITLFIIIYKSQKKSKIYTPNKCGAIFSVVHSHGWFKIKMLKDGQWYWALDEMIAVTEEPQFGYRYRKTVIKHFTQAQMLHITEELSEQEFYFEYVKAIENKVMCYNDDITLKIQRITSKLTLT